MKVTISCHRCAGTGRLVLTGEYLTTLIKLAALRREVTGAELGVIMGVAGTAMNNRLSVLEKHGLATKRQWGRKVLYQSKNREHA